MTAPQSHLMLADAFCNCTYEYAVSCIYRKFADLSIKSVQQRRRRAEMNDESYDSLI